MPDHVTETHSFTGHGNNAFETNQNKGANRSADAGKPTIKAELWHDDPHRGVVHNARHPGTLNVDENSAPHAASEQTSAKHLLEASTPGSSWAQRDVTQHIEAMRHLLAHPAGRALVGEPVAKAYEDHAKAMPGERPAKSTGIVAAGHGFHDKTLTDRMRPLLHAAHSFLERAAAHGKSAPPRPMGAGGASVPPTPTKVPEPEQKAAEPEAPIDLAHEEGADAGMKIHPFNTIARLKHSFPGMSQKQRRKMLADTHSMSTASAARYDRQFHAVPEATSAEHSAGEGPNKLAARPLPPRVPLETYRGVPQAHEQAAIAPTPPTPAAAPSDMHAYNYHKQGPNGTQTTHVGHSPNPLHAAVYQAHWAARGGHGEPVHLAAKASKPAPVQAQLINKTNPENVKALPAGPQEAKPFRTGTLAPQPVKSVEEANDRDPTQTRPDTFHQGMLETIHRQALKSGRTALAKAAKGAMSNTPGDHVKVGKLLPEGHFAEDHDWENEEANQHLDNWVEEHAKRLINTADARTANLSHAKFWDMMHKQMGNGGGKNSQHGEFWNRMNREFRTKGSATKNNHAVSQFKGQSPQTMKNKMQEAIERIRNKHVDQAHYRGESPKIGDQA